MASHLGTKYVCVDRGVGSGLWGLEVEKWICSQELPYTMAPVAAGVGFVPVCLVPQPVFLTRPQTDSSRNF